MAMMADMSSPLVCCRSTAEPLALHNPSAEPGRTRRLPSSCRLRILWIFLVLASVLQRSQPTIAAGGLRRIGQPEEALTDYHDQWAVIIGIDTYEDDSFRPLSFAVSDAQALRDLLVSEFGYPEQHVLLLKNRLASGLAIRAAFENWLPSRGLVAHDAVLVFFAGHGFLGRDTQGGYIAAADTRANDLEKSAIRVEWLRMQLGKLHPAGGNAELIHKLLILDSCYSGSLFQSVRRSDVATREQLARGRSPARPGADNLGFYLHQPAFFAMSAGRFTPVMDGSSDSPHSVFTSVLLSVLRERADSIRSDHAFTFRQLAIQVESRVMNAIGSQQVPDWGPVSSSDGDFVFRPRPARHTLSTAVAPWSGDSRLTPSEERSLAARRQRYALDMSIAWELFERGDLAAVDSLLSQQRPNPGQVDIRAFDWYYLYRLCHSERLRINVPDAVSRSADILTASLSSDGRRLAASFGAKDTHGPSSIHVWALDEPSPRHLMTVSYPKDLRTLAFSEDNRVLAGGWSWQRNERATTHGGIALWKLDAAADGTPLLLPGDAGVARITFSPDGRLLAASTVDHGAAVSIWSLAGGPSQPNVLRGNSFFASVQFSRDGKTLLAGDMRGSLWRWSTAGKNLIGRRNYGTVNISLSHDGRMIALSEKAKRKGHGRVTFIDLERGAETPFELSATQEAEYVGFAEDELSAVILTTDSPDSDYPRIQTVDPQTGRILGRLLGPSLKNLRPFAHGFAHKTLVSIEGREIVLWDAEGYRTHSRLRVLDAEPGAFPPSALSSDGRWLALVHDGEGLSRWDIPNGVKQAFIKWPAERTIHGLAFSSDGFKLAIGDTGSDSRIWLYDFNTNSSRVLAQDRYAELVHTSTLVFSPDGQFLLAANDLNGSYGVWRISTGELVSHVEGKFSISAPGRCGFFPGGRSVFAISPENLLLEFDLTGRHELRRLQPLVAATDDRAPTSGACAISREGRWWAAGLPHGSLGIVALDAPSKLPRIAGRHFKAIAAAVFDPDTRTLATGSDDGAIRLWLPSGELLREVRPSTSGAAPLQSKEGFFFAGGEGSRVRSLAFSPDGSTLVALSEPGEIEMWRAASEDELISRQENVLRFKEIDLPEARLNLLRSYWADALSKSQAQDNDSAIARVRKALALVDEIESASPGEHLEEEEWRRALSALLRYLHR